MTTEADRVPDPIREQTTDVQPAATLSVPQDSAIDQVAAVQLFSAETAQANPFESTNQAERFGLNRGAAERFMNAWLPNSADNSVLSELREKKADDDEDSRPLRNDEFRLIEDNSL